MARPRKILKPQPPQKNTDTKGYTTSLFCLSTLPKELGEELLKLRSIIKIPVWVLIQNFNEGPFNSLDNKVWNLFVSGEKELKKNKPVAIVIDSPGGDAKNAYKIARLLHERCGPFSVYIPRYAKSAATLLSLGAKEIYMGEHAEIGPLDVQVWDADREGYCSALDTVHSLQRLRAFSLESLDEAMMLMIGRTGKKVDSLISHTMHFITEMVNPLFNKIDVIEFTKMSRILKVAEEYAKRLLFFNHTEENALKIASRLVEHYPEHGFFIGRKEAKEMGLPIIKPKQAIDEIMDKVYYLLRSNDVQAFGQVNKITNEK